jgi:CMP-N-acetylneuraminic acid synthetase
MSVRLGDNDTLSHVFDPAPLVTGNTRSQDHAPVYHPNGGFYFGWRDRLVEHGNYFRGRTRGYVMPRVHSADVDDELDFEYAEFLSASGRLEAPGGT